MEFSELYHNSINSAVEYLLNYGFLRKVMEVRYEQIKIER